MSGVARLRDYVVGNAPWLAAGGLLTFLSSFGQTFFISIFAGEIRAEFGLSHGQWGTIYSLGTTLSAVVVIWAGALTDIFRVRVIGGLVLAGLALSCLLMAINPYAALLPVVIFCLRFFGQGMTSHIASVAMARWFSRTRGRALAIASLGFSFGEALLPLIFVSAMALTGWKALWVVVALVALAGIPALRSLLSQERTPQSLAASQSSRGMLDRHWTRWQCLRHPLFWMMTPALLGPSAFNTAFFFHQVHFAEIKGWSHIQLVAMFPVYTAVSVFAVFLSGWALDKWGTPRLIPFYQLPMVAAFACFAFAQSPAVALTGMVFLGLTSGANSTLPAAFWAEFYGTAHLGSIKAMAAAVMVFGSAIGPGITGVLIDLGLGLESQFLAVGGFFLFATAMIWAGVGRARASLPL